MGVNKRGHHSKGSGSPKSGGSSNTGGGGSSKTGGGKRGPRHGHGNKGKGRGGSGKPKNQQPSVNWDQYISDIQSRGRGFDWNKGFQIPTFDASNLQTIGDRVDFDANRMSIQGYDPSRIAERTTNPLLSSGAARDDVALADFWAAQQRIRTQAEQRMRDIDSHRLSYSELLGDLGTEGQQYSSELDRLEPIGDFYDREVPRTQGFGKQFTDELNRLRSFDERFQTSIKGLREGWDEHRNQRVAAGSQPRRGDVGRAWESTLKGLEDQYSAYQRHRGNVQSGQSRFKSYSDALTEGSRDYQSYLGQLQSGQRSLSDYTSQVQREQSQLEDYASAFSAARQRSAADAKSYTIRSQQGMASAAREGVKGIKSTTGYTSPDKDRNKSTKRRFNREFRIDSFGNIQQPQLNV